MARYKVLIDDNFHYMDETERSEHGIFDSAEAAVAACRSIVDRSLRDLYQPPMTEDELCGQYVLFGEDPFIVALDGAPAAPFSARDYAREHSAAVCFPVQLAQRSCSTWRQPCDGCASGSENERYVWRRNNGSGL